MYFSVSKKTPAASGSTTTHDVELLTPATSGSTMMTPARPSSVNDGVSEVMTGNQFGAQGTIELIPRLAALEGIKTHALCKLTLRTLY